MSSSHRAIILFALSAGSSIFLGGCASTKSQSFITPFLPPTPIPVPDVPIEQPPRVTQRLYTSETPNLTPKTPPEIDRRLQTAEARFEAGKRAYQSGDAKLARQEFDRSLDALLSAPQDLAERQRLERRLDELVDSIYRYDLDRLGAGESTQAVVYDKSPLESMLELTFPTDPKLKPKVKEEIQATVSQLPLEGHDAVLSYINYFSSESGRKVIVAGLRRAGRYRQLIQRILDEEGVPQELISLAQAESAFMPRAISNKEATGMWQFMKFTGQLYGLRQIPGIDERLDPEKATRAAARHLRDLYTMFGDWYLAMAAYNCGSACVERAVQRTGYADFWELSARNVLPKQTMNYVPLILAMTIMAKNPKDYGLDRIDLDRPLEYDTFEVNSPTNIELIADAADRSVSEVRELNPALLRSVAPAGYQMRVPKGASNVVVTALGNIPEIHRATWRLHRVVPGETLATIAKRYNTPADAMAAANRMTVEAPEAGDLLVVPTSFDPDRVIAPRKALARTARRGPTRASTAHRAVATRVSPAVLHRKAGKQHVRTAAVASHASGQ